MPSNSGQGKGNVLYASGDLPKKAEKSRKIAEKNANFCFKH